MGTTLFVTDQVVGKYRIVGELGRGAMGTVFKAVDETLDREVAIKVLNPELANAKFIKRFEAEATTLAKLNHPSIATIYELVRSAAGLLMVMEFVAGETLETIADRVGTLAPERAASLIDKVLAGLAYAHRAGIVHCDVKPANVIVTPHGVKIMDFGVARVRGAGHVLPDGYVIGNEYAPEHLGLSVRDPWRWVEKINNSGGVFMGEHSFEVLGDYLAGPSHVMPTGGTARFASPLNVWDFVKIVSLVALDESTAQAIGPIAATIAESEQLDAHANAALLRSKEIT